MFAMAIESFKGKQAKRPHEPPWPAQQIPGAQKIDCYEGGMAPMGSAIAKCGPKENRSMVDGRRDEQNSNDSEEGFAGRVAADL
jgi:hypothetical protein